MNTARTALALSALLGGSLLLGVSPALAAPAPLACPATMHSVDPATHGGEDCQPNVTPTEPLAQGNNWSIWASQPTYAPGPPPQHLVQPPAYKPLPAPAAPEVPNRAIQVPAGEARPGSVVAGGNAHGPNWAPAGNPAAAAPAGETLPSVTPVAGQAAVNGEAPAEQAPAAVVLPTTELQAVDALRSVTATPAEKDAAKAIVKTKIDAVLDKAIEKVLAGH